LTPLASARNCLKPFYFIGRRGAKAARCGGGLAGVADILLHDQEDKKQDFRAYAGGNGYKFQMQHLEPTGK
jgi:hypothetical protein